MYPGREYHVGPGVGTYTPKEPGSIGVVANAIKRRAEKLMHLRRPQSKQAPEPAPEPEPEPAPEPEPEPEPEP